MIERPDEAWILMRVVVLGKMVNALLRRKGVAGTARLLRPRSRVRPRPEGLETRRAKALVALADPVYRSWVKGACLERSLVLYRLLNLEGAPVDLVIGLRARSGEVDGHAWLAMDGRPVLEREDPEAEFRPLLLFPSPLSAADGPYPLLLRDQGRGARLAE